MSGNDRIQRIIMGVVLLLLNIFGGGLKNGEWTSIVSLVLQIELLATGLVGWCPLYWSLSLRKNEQTN